MSELPRSFQVVIAGGGFAGIECAKALARALGPGSERRVALVADQNYMLFQPMLAEVAGSSVSPRHVVNPIRALCRGVTVLRASIERIDPEATQLELNAGDFTQNVKVGFEHLVLAMGSVVDLSKVPGMAEHALLMKNVGDALKLRGVVIDRFEEASLIDDPARLAALMTFVVVGGGYSGVEIAGQLLDLADAVHKDYPRMAVASCRVVLIHSGETLLPEISAKLGKYCEQTLRERGVEIILKARVTAMTSSRVVLGDGREIESHAVISTVGNAPHPRITELCKEAGLATVKGRVSTEPTLRVPGKTWLWAAGDCAAVPQADGTLSPPTAQFATRQGKLLGNNLAKMLAGREDLDAFTFKSLGSLAAIGHHRAVADIMGLQFSGFLAWWLWRTIYLAKLPGFERKLRVVMDWTLDLFFARDISLLQPRYTRLLADVHLETGDAVFHAGEPAFSFYVVKTGRIELRDVAGKVVRVLGPGEPFGQRALAEDRRWRYSAVAAEPSTLVSLSVRIFEAIGRAPAALRDRVFEGEGAKAPGDGALPEA